MARGTVAAFRVDRLEDRRGGGQRQARAAVFLGDQRGQIACLGERVDELGGIFPPLVQLAPVFAGKAGAEFRDFIADLGMRVGGKLLVHVGLPRLALAA